LQKDFGFALISESSVVLFDL